MERHEAGFVVRTIERTQSDKLALQTAVVHLFCSVICIIIGVFSLAVIKSETIERVYGLPLWIGLLLLSTGFSGIICHVKKTKPYAAAYVILSFLAMFFDLIGIAWMLSALRKSEAAVISLVCVCTFDMGISCLSTALGCNILFTDCKMCKNRRRQGSHYVSPDESCTLPSGSQLAVHSGSSNEDSVDGGLRESVHLSSVSTGQARYIRQYPPRPGDEPPSYAEAIDPPPAYSQS